MTTGALIALFVAVAIVVAAIQLTKRKERATTHDDEDNVFSRAPRFAGILNQKLNLVLAGQRRLHRHIDSEAEADEERDTKMSAETQAAIDELKAEVAPISDAVTAVSTTVDRLIAMMEEAGDDPVEIRAVIANLKSEKDRIIAAALKGTPIDPSAE